MSSRLNPPPSSTDMSKWLTMIRRHASDANPFHAISFFKAIPRNQRENAPLDDHFIYASLIKACNRLSAIREGRSIHCHVLRFGLDYNVNVLNALVYLYSSAEKSMGCACALFDKIPDKTVVTVNCMISGFVKNKRFDAGVGLFNRVLGGGFDLRVKPNYVTLVILISGCVEFGRFSIGNSLHCYCCKTRLDLKNEVRNALIHLYAEFEYMDDAAKLFHETNVRDLVSWNTMIAGYAKNNDCRNAFSLFREMRVGNVECDRVSLVSLISACTNSRDLHMGKAVHAYIKVSGMEMMIHFETALINMYSKCGSIELGRKVFDELADENIASWNSMIYGYVECGFNIEALSLWNVIQSRKIKPDEVTMLGLISACRSSGDLHQGIQINSYIESSDHLSGSTVLCNALIDMYAKCGSMDQAETVFSKMPRRDVISWTSIIVGYAINGEGEEALLAFRKMGAEKIEPNSVTFLGVLSACDHAGLVDKGKNLYNIMCKYYHIEPKIEHCGCMVDMHARAGMLEEAYKFVKDMPVEPNAVVWRMLINACRVYGDFNLGLNLVSGLIDVKAVHGPEDHVISSNIFAEAGRWDDVLQERSLMVAQKAVKLPGKSSIADSLE
ncbi:pentatricopeptide repeat-containing protein At4g33990-like [Vitis riparia]|uniref:pentatricopeptide repeat-containing protein At4g33990-like n=1 Tax=Vitis riparia TaxID=96939 RepID=UPI00155A6CBC|nr:pentatricopeptide repeat-containing protein At4g33990-like [Vitis riparia]